MEVSGIFHLVIPRLPITFTDKTSRRDHYEN